MSDEAPAVTELPPSAKLVYKQLQWEGSQTQAQLAEETMLPRRTVRFALNQLEEAGAVTERVHVPDARKKVYALREDARAPTGPST